jgi:hypothetical protein
MSRSADPPAPARSVRRSLGSIVLGFESIVVFLGALVMLGLGALPAPVALIGGIGLCVALLTAAWLLRFPWGVAVGWVLQAIVVASGFIIVAMFVIGALFTALWTYCMIVGTRIDRTNTNNKENTP